MLVVRIVWRRVDLKHHLRLDFEVERKENEERNSMKILWCVCVCVPIISSENNHHRNQCEKTKSMVTRIFVPIRLANGE